MRSEWVAWMNIEELKILVIDDHRIIRNLEKHYLETMGIKNIEFADNGREALDKIEAGHFDILFADLNMPVINGEELLKIIRSKPQYDKMAFVMVTAESENSKILEILNAGATFYLIKPFSPESFKQNVEKILDWLKEREVRTTAQEAR
jgi:two-component system chemotaxis response regulator CheY